METFVATIDGEPCGVVSVHPDKDYFTGHLRAYVEILAVARSGRPGCGTRVNGLHRALGP
jgi:hypothetical protein